MNIQTKTITLQDERDAMGLDMPVASSFDAHWGIFAEHHGTAKALPPDIGPFATIGAHSCDFVEMVNDRTSPVIILQRDEITVPTGLTVMARMKGVQLVAQQMVDTGAPIAIDELGAADAPDMLALTQLTQPGPFAINTHHLGEYIGIRRGGRLIAMAGQRMAFLGWVEISAVCVHPDHRQQGLAQQLVIAMMDRIIRSGATPFLHTFADNHGAIALYQRLGFALRCEMQIAQVAGEQQDN